MKNNHRCEYGFTLIEMMIVLTIVGIFVAGFSTYQMDVAKSARAQAVSAHMHTISQAVDAYIADNYAALNVVASADRPILLSVADLVSADFLPAGYSQTNAFNQHVCALIVRPAVGKLAGLVVAESIASTSKRATDGELVNIVTSIGASSGAIYAMSPTTITGAYNSYALTFAPFSNNNYRVNTTTSTRCDGVTPGAVQLSSGHSVVALWFNDKNQTTGFLYRNDVGDPSLNTMTTTLGMSNNNIEDVGELRGRRVLLSELLEVANSVTVGGNLEANSLDVTNNASIGGKVTASTLLAQTIATDGMPCPHNAINGEIARDTEGKLLTCQVGIWTSVFKPAFEPGKDCASGDQPIIHNGSTYYCATHSQANLPSIANCNVTSTMTGYQRLSGTFITSYWNNGYTVRPYSSSTVCGESTQFYNNYSNTGTPYDWSWRIGSEVPTQGQCNQYYQRNYDVPTYTNRYTNTSSDYKYCRVN